MPLYLRVPRCREAWPPARHPARCLTSPPTPIPHRRYRTLDEAERDPEGGGPYTPTAAAAANGGGGGGGSFELTAAGGARDTSIDLGSGKGSKPRADSLPSVRGLTTPQKLQRSVSNSTEEAAQQSALGGATPRALVGSAQSPLR